MTPLLMRPHFIDENSGSIDEIQLDQSKQDGGTLGEVEMGWMYLQSWDRCGFGGPEGEL